MCGRGKFLKMGEDPLGVLLSLFPLPRVFFSCAKRRMYPYGWRERDGSKLCFPVALILLSLFSPLTRSFLSPPPSSKPRERWKEELNDQRTGRPKRRMRAFLVSVFFSLLQFPGKISADNSGPKSWCGSFLFPFFLTLRFLSLRSLRSKIVQQSERKKRRTVLPSSSDLPQSVLQSMKLGK